MWTTPRAQRFTFLAGALLAIGGCASNVDIPGYPLYAGPRLPRDQLVRVFGSLASVDGADVSSLGSAFEVLPGCHVVLTRNEAVESTNTVTALGQTGGRAFVISMKPGYSFYFRREVTGQVTAAVGNGLGAHVFADERDPSGASRRSIEPVAPGTQLARACQDAPP
jgi:hypothetical protein